MLAKNGGLSRIFLQKVAKEAKVLTACAGEEETGDAVGEFWFVEVDEEAEGDVEEFHVTEELGFVDREHLFD